MKHSMWPLLVRDGQALQYIGITLLWNFVIGYSPSAVQSSLIRYAGYVSSLQDISIFIPWLNMSWQVIYGGIAMLHLPDLFPNFLRPPTRYPDLYIVLNVSLSFAVFGSAWLWGMKRLLEIRWAIGGLEERRPRVRKHEMKSE